MVCQKQPIRIQPLICFCVLAATPVMEFGPKNMTVLDGKDATLSCRAAGAPIPNVTWIYNGMSEKKK